MASAVPNLEPQADLAADKLLLDVALASEFWAIWHHTQPRHYLLSAESPHRIFASQLYWLDSKAVASETGNMTFVHPAQGRTRPLKDLSGTNKACLEGNVRLVSIVVIVHVDLKLSYQVDRTPNEGTSKIEHNRDRSFCELLLVWGTWKHILRRSLSFSGWFIWWTEYMFKLAGLCRLYLVSRLACFVEGEVRCRTRFDMLSI